MIQSYQRKPILVTAYIALLLCVTSRDVSAQFEHAGRGGTAAANSVYRIICPERDRGGTAFGHRSGRIITAEHIVHDCDLKKLRVIAPSGVATGITAVASDENLDLALLTPTISDFVKVPLDLVSDPEISIGAQVSTWGFPEGYGGPMPLLSVGYLSGVQEFRTKSGVQSRKWVVNGAFNSGNSGGPLLETKTARVLGVISSKLAPMPKQLETRLEELEKSGSTEIQDIAKMLKHLRKQTQLVLGFATMTADLNTFLKKNGVGQ